MTVMLELNSLSLLKDKEVHGCVMMVHFENKNVMVAVKSWLVERLD